jgi:hypothetical protein
MPDFERLTDELGIWAAPSPAAQEWRRGYKAGKSRARLEVLAILVGLYFSLVLLGKCSGA